MERVEAAIVDPLPALESVTIALWVASGSRDDLPRARGAAHLLEHLVTSTTLSDRGNIFHLCDALGGRSEAATTPEFALYAATLPCSRFAEGWELLRDQFLTPDLTAVHFEAERSAVLDEISGARADPGRLIHECALEEVFGDHPLGYPACGRSGDVLGLTTSAIAQQHVVQLQSRCIPIVSGGVDPDEAQDTLAGAFAGPVASAVGTRSLPHVLHIGDCRRKVAGLRSHVLLTWVLPERTSGDDVVLSVVNRLLGGSSAGVLQQAFSGEEGGYSCHTYRSVFSDCAVLSAYVSCSAGAIDPSIGRMNRAVSSAWDGVLRDQEALDSAGRALDGSFAIGMQSTRMRVNWLGRAMIDAPANDPVTIPRRSPAHSAVTVDAVSKLRSRLVGPHVTVLEGVALR
ncbi:MAG: insulinase family protein [Actinomyces sp.]|nr:pitrilysin family protein [Actinomyces sp.]MCI1641539.1 insulinase family protein [Actinomyces sp.]MCI1661717.1 insulinase family protein [Actinomyces sp.]MCI1690465.1 insulinase family protein [Actinomyces sp.]MCI1786443.1 insulinase family protein [Actinomyces sp.]MCI1866151.1 insulinase family protein [Actinomyces sp.]